MFKCPICDETFGQEKRFSNHIVDIHGIGDIESLYVTLELNDVKPTCGCGCGKSLPWAGWKKGYISKFARGHNAIIDSVYLDPIRQKEFVTKRKKSYADGKFKVWNDGLTKSTSKKVKTASKKISKTLSDRYKSGDLVDWRLSNPKKAKVAAEKISITKQKQFESGELNVWNKGLTKQLDLRIQKMSKNISQKLRENLYSSSKRFKPNELIELVKEIGPNFKLLTDPKNYRNKYQKLELLCLTCDQIQKKNVMMLVSTPKCFNCHPKASSGQLEVFEFVKSLVDDAVLDDKTMIAPRELDVWIPSQNLAIEYNGLYWHSLDHKPDKDYHQKKLEACIKKGISLLAIYEDEWRDSREICESMIRHRLGLSKRKLFARSLDIVILTSKQKKEFFNNNHLEGDTPSRVAFGLKDPISDDIVASMSIRVPFHKKHASDCLEVARCCAKANTNVPGWLGRLTKVSHEYTLKAEKCGLMTYVDARVGPGNAYKKAGWTLMNHDTGSRFWWTDFENRFNRFKFKADRSRNMSQAQVAEEAGVVMIYGCSNSLWTTVTDSFPAESAAPQ